MKLQSVDRLRLVVGGLSVIALLVALGGFLLVVQPQRHKVATIDSEIAAQQLALSGMHARAGATRSDLRAAELFQLSRALPDAPDQPGILLTLAQLAQRTGVALSSVQPKGTVSLSDGASGVPLAVVVTGSWTSVTRFLAAVRAEVTVEGSKLSVAGRLFDIDQVSVSPNGAAGGPIVAQLTMSAFVFGAPPVPTTSTSTTTTTSTTSSSQQAAGATQGS